MVVKGLLYAGGVNQGYNYPRYGMDLQLLGSSLLRLDGSSLDYLQFLYGPGNIQLDTSGGFVVAGDASKNSLTTALSDFTQTVSNEDIFVVVISNHGGPLKKGVFESKIWCWNEENISASDFASLCNAIPSKYQIFILGQCNSGGCIPALESQNRIILTACAWDEVSYASSAYAGQYDEFLLRVAEGFDASLKSIRDIFSYAKRSDREDESPQYSDLGNLGNKILVYK
ncbi:MAG: C13 family peptidase [Cyanobacteria bacterium P01_D01_bin.6]